MGTWTEAHDEAWFRRRVLAGDVWKVDGDGDVRHRRCGELVADDGMDYGAVRAACMAHRCARARRGYALVRVVLEVRTGRGPRGVAKRLGAFIERGTFREAAGDAGVEVGRVLRLEERSVL